MPIWIVIPVKPLSDVKRRLSDVLSAAERARLIERFLDRELTVLNETAVDHVLIVSSDPRIIALAEKHGAEVLVEEKVEGLNTAVSVGVEKATAAGASGILVLPADLPFLTAKDITLLLQTIHAGQNGRHKEGRPPLMAISADKLGEGTNALFLAPPPASFTFQFGPGSFRRHVAEAAHHGLACHIVSSPGLSFDLDTAADWQRYKELVTSDWRLAIGD